MSDDSIILVCNQVTGGGFPVGGTGDGGSPTGGARGIYINNNKVVVIRNIETGKLYTVNNYEKFKRYMRRKIFAWAEVTEARKGDFGNSYVLIQLSYKNNLAWRQKQLTDFIQAIISRVGKENVYDYGYALEIKPIGRNLHYHLAMHINSKIFVPRPDQPGLWELGSTHIYRGRSSPYYLCKYVSKQHQKEGDEFPRGSRKYGVWLNSLYYSAEEIMVVRRASYPKYVLDKIDQLGIVNFSVNRCVGGGWLVVSKDLLGDCTDLQVKVVSPYSVYIGDEVKVHFTDDELALGQVGAQVSHAWKAPEIS